MRKSSLTLSVLLLTTLSAFGGAVTSTWNDGNGLWSISSNWNNGVPNNGGGNSYTAVIDNGSSVTLDISVTLDNLTIASSNSLAVNNGSVLAMNGLAGAGSIVNYGNLSLNSSGGNTDLALVGGGTVTLGGSGTFTMSNSTNNRIYGANTTELVIGANQLVQGAGQIGLNQTTITNNGTITANQSAGLTIMPNGSGFTNTNLMQATSGATLTLSGVINNTSATIQAVGTGSTVKLNNATVTGGTLISLGGGIIENVNNSTLNAITNQGTIQTDNAAITYLRGTITNSGLLTLNSSGAFADLFLVGGGTVTLSGTGTLTMSNNLNNRIYGGNTTALVIGANQLIQGAGQIGYGQTTITNNGTITANQPAGMIISPNGSGFTNTSLVQATSGAALTLSGIINNTSATIQAVGTGSTVKLNSATINGGTLISSGGGLIENVGNSALNAITNQGTIQTDNGAYTSLQGTITNSGLLTLNSSGGNTDLPVIGGGTVTLSGTGTLTMTNNANNRIYGGNTTVLVIGANQLVQGAGQIGVSQTTITNNGTITANQSAGLTIIPNSEGFTNNNIVQATSGAPLTLSGTFINNGTIRAVGSGSIVKLNGTTINGGTLSSSSGGLIENINNATLNGITNQGTIQTDNGSTTYLRGTITNSGLLTLNSSGGNTDLPLVGGGTVTLSGSGTLIMSNSVNNRIFGGNTTALLIGAGQLVQGAGQIGVSQTTITNNGTITVNQPVGMTISPNTGGFANNGTLNANSGTLTILGTGVSTGSFVANAGAILKFDGATQTLNSPASLTGAGTASFSSGAVVNLAGTYNVDTTSIDNARLNFLPGASIGQRVFRTKSLSITNNAKLDLGNSHAIVDYTGASPISSVRAALLSAYAPVAHWTGNGLTSSTAAANSKLALGYGEAADIFSISGTQTALFDGQSVDATSVLVRLTLNGDANLDGSVGFPDLVVVAQHYGLASTGTWTTGDFNYDGDIGFADLVAVAQNYGGATPGSIPDASANFNHDLASAFAQVPEPAALAIVLFASLAALRPAHRRQR